MSQDRQFERVDVEVAAEVHVESGVLLAATRNLSEGGVCLETDTALAKGSTVNLALFLTLEGIEDEAVEPLSVAASVVWATTRAPGAHTAGARFAKLRPEDQTRIAEFVKAVRSAGR